jgi:hypothetical protein
MEGECTQVYLYEKNTAHSVGRSIYIQVQRPCNPIFSLLVLRFTDGHFEVELFDSKFQIYRYNRARRLYGWSRTV